MAGDRDEDKSAEDAEEAKEPEGEASSEAAAPEETNEAAAKTNEAETNEAETNEAETNAPPAEANVGHVRADLPEGAAWAKPIVRFDRAWSWVETRLLFVLLLSLVISLVVWISLRGMASPVEADNSAGTVFRALIGAGVLGAIARVITGRIKNFDETRRALTTLVLMIVGVVLAPFWRKVGVARFDGIFNWLQEGSSLSLFGGLRGIATRLTLLVALIGSSLAAAHSKHINIDVFLRFMRPSLRKPVHVLGALATAAVCFAASWGFFDYISIEGFGQRKELPASAKIAAVREGSSRHFFLLRRQIGLDLRAAPSVIFSGTRWDDPSRMNGRTWNAWLDESGFAETFTAEEVQQMRAPKGAEEEPRVPMVVLPGDNVRGLLLQDMNLMWTFGFFIIGLRVLMRALLVVAGHASVEPDAEEPDEDADETRDPVAEEGAR